MDQNHQVRMTYWNPVGSDWVIPVRPVEFEINEKLVYNADSNIYFVRMKLNCVVLFRVNLSVISNRQ